MTILPRLVNISPQKVMFTPKYVDLCALSSVVASRIYALFVVKSTRVPRLGGGGGGQANLGNVRIFKASLIEMASLSVVKSKVEAQSDPKTSFSLFYHHRQHHHHHDQKTRANIACWQYSKIKISILHFHFHSNQHHHHPHHQHHQHHLHHQQQHHHWRLFKVVGGAVCSPSEHNWHRTIVNVRFTPGFRIHAVWLEYLIQCCSYLPWFLLDFIKV